ncbi:alcohol dehydrogenase [Saitoella complicata NRRL Y-17804]|nr:alcohol dehydrogenase [Saitoella complicata NRRL Y-17804]ODQ51765.1 alcohol dehydrogenase [Saitoella complicata NRRL Y-17804]
MTMSIPKTAKACVIEAAKAPFKIVEREVEQPKQGEILIKTLACGVCHSDSIVKEGYWPVPCPVIPGHEIIGRVVAVGPEEKRWKVGQIVGGGWHGGQCFACDNCRVGSFTTCENGTVNGIFKDGGYAEYCCLRSEAVVAIPDGMSYTEAAPLLCAGVTTYNSLRNTGAKAGDLVAVQGIGGLGHLGVQFANKMGFRVAALSAGSAKEQLAKELGAHYYIDGSKVDQVEELQKLGGAKVIMCTAPHPESISPLVGGLCTDGTILILAATGNITFDTTAMIQKRAKIMAWPSGHAKDSEETCEFAKIAGVKTKVEEFPFTVEGIEEAYTRMMENKVRFRSVIKFDE